MKILAAPKSKREKELEAIIKKASDAYYNTGKAIMSDREFDNLVEELKRLNPKSKVLDEIGSPVKKQKVKLPYFMASLDKLKSDNADSWLLANEKYSMMVSDKIDGVSILIVYSRAGVRAYTRGDGTYGQDISFLVPHLKIPKLKTNLVLRGEIVMPVSKFNAWKSQFENPRNMVSGLVNRKTVHRATKDLDVVIYEQLNPRQKQSDALKKLKSLGFKTVSFKVYKTLDAATLSKIYRKRKETSLYEIDGLVLTLDKNNPVNTSGNPKWSKAFKENFAGSEVETKVIKVHWQISKNGLLKPRVEVSPIRLSGVTVKFATGFNGKYIQDNRIGKDAVVTLTRSGDVIPYIVNVKKKAIKPDMPDEKKYNYTWNKNGVELVVENPKKHKDYHIKRIVSFFKILGVENLSSGMASKFYAVGLKKISDYLKATPATFMKAPGVQDKSARKIYDNIQKSINKIPLHKLMAASGLFPNMAEKKLKKLVETYPNILTEYKRIPATSLENKIAEIEGFSSITAKGFAKHLEKFDKFIARLPNISYEKPKPKSAVTTKGSMSGKTIVFTGFRDKYAEAVIEKKGGNVGNSISKNTSILVVKDAAFESTKTRKAKSLGVTVMGKDEFDKWLAKQ